MMDRLILGLGWSGGTWLLRLDIALSGKVSSPRQDVVLP